ncbi:GFA family protein [Rhizobium halophilum]|uniref:GFA family protein n=1 Tax=Rhizobium halophilum TaxID=2846852 RepID=UPI001EFD1940|nr:GFA family protein [Rhizobium halophilum]MCF6370281.1 GFA family protein [Rhizobium halophilum]
MIIRSGGCLCGNVKYSVKGPPLRVGLCHCAVCRKESGSAFVTFAVWPAHSFETAGEIAIFGGRGFCRSCGSRLFNPQDGEVEVRLGSLDMAPTDLAPTYEIWVKRRETWLHPLAGLEQFEEDRGE